MGRRARDLDELMEAWTQIAQGRLVDEELSYRQAVRILAERLATLVHPGDARHPYVAAMLKQGYRRGTAYKVVNSAFARAAHGAALREPVHAEMGKPVRPASQATDPVKVHEVATPGRPDTPETSSRDPKSGPVPRAPLLADPAHYARRGQPAFGATPWRYFQNNPRLPLYAPAAYPMSEAGVPVLDARNWVAPYGVDDSGTPLAPYGVTHRYGYPVRREGVPPASPLPSPKAHATGEEGWDDW